MKNSNLGLFFIKRTLQLIKSWVHPSKLLPLHQCCLNLESVNLPFWFTIPHASIEGCSWVSKGKHFQTSGESTGRICSFVVCSSVTDEQVLITDSERWNGFFGQSWVENFVSFCSSTSYNAAASLSWGHCGCIHVLKYKQMPHVYLQFIYRKCLKCIFN